MLSRSLCFKCEMRLKECAAKQPKENTAEIVHFMAVALAEPPELFASRWREGYVLCRNWSWKAGRSADVKGGPPEWCPYALEHVVAGKDIEMHMRTTAKTLETAHAHPSCGRQQAGSRNHR